MLHFVCKPADPSLDPKAMAEEIFDLEYPHLVVMEQWTKAGKNPHWHFQGTPKDAFNTAKAQRKFIERLNAEHPKRQLPGCEKARTCARRTEWADETGFAYMMKQIDNTIVMKSDDLDEQELRIASSEYVKEKKDEMPTWVRERLPKRPLDPPELHSEWRFLALEYYTEKEKQPPPRNQANVLWGMATTTGASTATKRYVSERI